MLAALVLFPVLILGDQWHTHQIVDLRHHEAKAAAAILVGVLRSSPSPGSSAAGRC